MYMGHAGIALLGKGVRKEVPLWVFVGAAFGLDLVKYGLMLVGFSDPDRLYSNSIPAALCIALVAGGVYYGAVQRDSSGAGVVALIALSHWLADFITGRVPLWPFGSEAGLRLFLHGWWNFAFEAAVVLAGWLVYRRSLTPKARRSWAAWAIPVVLLAFQLLFLYEN